jgi:hypothetical protein
MHAKRNCRRSLSAGLKKVASAILADVEPWLPARRIGAATDQTSVNSERFTLRSSFPGGRMPPSTAGKDACRHIFRQALSGVTRQLPVLRDAYRMADDLMKI